MVRYDYYKTREDGRNLYRAYSDENMMIRKNGTEERYAEAIDMEDIGFTYTETDIPIEDDGTLTLEDSLKMLNELGVDINDN